MRPGKTSLEPDSNFDRHLDVTLRLFPVMSSLAGLCIVGLVFLQSAVANNVKIGWADEVLALDALLFVACMYLILWSGRTTSQALALRLFRIVDMTFLFALTTMLLSAAYIVYWVF